MKISANWKPWLAALLAAIVGIGATVAADRMLRERAIDHERRHVLDKLTQLRARLEGVLNGNLLMVRGLTAVIAADPGLDQSTFARIASGMLTPQHALRNIAGAPDLVIRLMYPVAGNEAAIGLDYRTHPTQREAALRAVETGTITLAGPLDLVQGGRGLVAREPVFVLAEHPDTPRRLWGLVSAVIDIDRLYQLAGLEEIEQSGQLALAIRGRDGRGADGDVFYGDPTLFTQQPELVEAAFPGGAWQIGAQPVAGWHSHVHHGEVLVTRVTGLFLTALVMILSYALTTKALALRRTADELAQSQHLFQGFMDNLPAGAFIRDIRAQQTLFENRWLQHHLPGGGHECGLDDEDDLACLDDGPYLVHHEMTTVAGHHIFCDTLRFLLTDGGTRDQVGGVVMDVTGRIDAERAATRSRARLRGLLNTIPDLVWMKDPDGVYLACNPRFEALFGANEEQIVGKRDHDFVPLQLADFFRDRDRAAIEAGRPLMNEETVTFASDGHTELLETIKTPVFDEDGKLMGVLGIARDITARRAAEDALRESAERLQAAESIAHIGNWEYRVADGTITWSDETYRILGLAPGQRQPDYAWWLAQIHPEDRRAHDAFMQRMLQASPADVFAEERFRVRRDDGAELVISVHVSIDFGPQDKPVRLFGTVQDITERDALTRDLRERLNELTRWQSVILGREDRILELKQEVNELLLQQGDAARYAADRQAL